MSVVIIFVMHIILNICVSSLSFYLAFALSKSDFDKSSFITYLSIIMISTFAITVAAKYFSSLIFMSINRNVHTKVVEALINTKMSFYDENTSGRILNRLSKDVEVIDRMVFNFLEMVDYIIKCLFSVAFMVFATPQYTIVVVMIQLGYVYWLKQKILVTTRECFRWKQMLNAPIISVIQDSINGQVTMRALAMHKQGLEELFKHSDWQTMSHVVSNGTNRWSAFRIDMQAYYTASIFAAVCLFGPFPGST